MPATFRTTIRCRSTRRCDSGATCRRSTATRTVSETTHPVSETTRPRSRTTRRLVDVTTALLIAFAALLATPARSQTTAVDRAQVGRHVFFDATLSEPRGVSCASCHNPDLGWAGNNGSVTGVAAGSHRDRLGRRNTPTVSYAAFVPPFAVKAVREDGQWVRKAVGGLFWDGRASSFEEQARGPLFAAAEMNLSGEADLAARLRAAPYADALRAAFGLSADADDATWAAAGIAALGAFQRSPEVSPFSSKYDAVLRRAARFTPAEARGRRLFMAEDKGNCAACHVVAERSRDPRRHLFTDFTYDALGLARNPRIPANADPDFFDLGLCGPDRRRPDGLDAAVCGAFRVPTLRNVAKRPFYFHNGLFTDLAQAVRFYVQRDTHPRDWYPRGGGNRVLRFDDLPARHRGNVNVDEAPYDRRPGQAPRLSEAEIADVVAFLRTLDDGYTR